MPYRRSRLRSFRPRQSGARTGASFSGMQDIIRHSNELEATIGTGKTQCFNLVCYNPTLHGTPVALDGSTAKVLTNNFTDLGSRVNNIAIDLTIKQTDTAKNNTCYTGLISTSFNEGQLKTSLMTTNFNDFITSTDTAGPPTYLGQMTCKATESAYDLHTYSLKDIQQHNIKGLLKPAHQLYSGRVITLNQNLPLPRKNRRQQDGSGLFLVIMNDSDPNGSDVEISLKTFFKEIPVNTV